MTLTRYPQVTLRRLPCLSRGTGTLTTGAWSFSMCYFSVLLQPERGRESELHIAWGSIRLAGEIESCRLATAILSQGASLPQFLILPHHPLHAESSAPCHTMECGGGGMVVVGTSLIAQQGGLVGSPLGFSPTSDTGCPCWPEKETATKHHYDDVDFL
jgi:hypothetical protein